LITPPPRHRTQTKKSEADQAEGGGVRGLVRSLALGFGGVQVSAAEKATLDDIAKARQALNLARRAVYSRDQKARKELATMAQGRPELGRAVASVPGSTEKEGR